MYVAILNFEAGVVDIINIYDEDPEEFVVNNYKLQNVEWMSMVELKLNIS